MYKPIILKSKDVNKNHLTIIVNAENSENAAAIIKRLKKAVHKLNRLEKINVSFEIFKNIRQARNS